MKWLNLDKGTRTQHENPSKVEPGNPFIEIEIFRHHRGDSTAWLEVHMLIAFEVTLKI